MIPDINLLPKLDKRQGSVKVLLMGVGIVTALVLAILMWQYFDVKSEIPLLISQQTSLQAERDQLQMEYDILTTVSTGSLADSVTFVERVSYAVSPLIDETQAILPKYTYLRSYSFSESGVSIVVDFESLTDIAAYVSRLENSAYFEDTQLSSVSNFEVDPASAEEEDEMAKFEEVPRYTTNISLMINQTYLATGGVR